MPFTFPVRISALSVLKKLFAGFGDIIFDFGKIERKWTPYQIFQIRVTLYPWDSPRFQNLDFRSGTVLLLDAYKTSDKPFPNSGRPLSKGLSQGGGFVVKLEPYLPAKPLGEGRRFHFAQYI